MARRANGVAERMWRERLARFGRSGLTVAEFCGREGVSTAAFYAWRRRLEPVSPQSRSTRVDVPGTPLFVPLSVRPSAPGVRITLPGGAVVELPRDADDRLVRSCILAAGEAGREAEGERC